MSDETKIEQLHVVKPRPDPKLIEQMDNLANMAMAGEIQSCVHVVVFQNGSIDYGTSGIRNEHAGAVVGTLHMLIESIANDYRKSHHGE